MGGGVEGDREKTDRERLGVKAARDGRKTVAGRLG